MNMSILIEELKNGPLVNELASLTDNEAANLLNKPQYPVIKERFITARSILAEIPNGGIILDKMEAASNFNPDLKWAMKFMTFPVDGGIDIGYVSTRTQIDALVTNNILTQEEGQSLKDMALQNISRAEVLGLGYVTYTDINIARNYV